LKEDALEELVRSWVRIVVERAGGSVAGGQVAIDGKAMRGSAGSSGTRVHMVGAMLTVSVRCAPQ